MNTKTSNWIRRLAGITTLLMVSMSYVGQASARILFQDDTVGQFESDQLNIGSNDAGALNTSIKFGADGTASENGVINWNITTNTFEVDHTTAITGGLSATGNVNFSQADSVRIQESSDPATFMGCSAVGELILDTTDNQIQVCTSTGSNAVAATLTNQTVTHTADTAGTSGNAISLAIVVGSSDNGGNNATATVTAVGNAITLTIDNDTNASAETVGQVGVRNCLNSAVSASVAGTGATAGDGNITCVVTNNVTALITSSGGTAATDAVALGSTSLSGGLNGTATWVATAAGNAGTLDNLDSTDFLRATASTTFGTGGAFTLTIGSDDTLQVNGTLDTNGVATIGDGGDSVTIDSSSWDVTGAGVGSGFTGFTSTGTVDFSGASRLALHQGAANPGTCTEGDIFYNTTSNTTYMCTATNTFTALSAGTQDFEGVYASDGDKSLSITDNLATGFEIKEGANSYVKLVTTDGSEAVQINEDAVIGDGGDTVAINSSSWDITSAGAASGLTTIGASGNITTSAGTFCVGTTCLNETTSAADSGAFIVGAFDEFDNSASTTVQDVLDDLDAKIGPNAPNADVLTFYPEYPDTVIFRDGGNNTGTLLADYDDTNDENYYDWTATPSGTQDIDLKFRFPLPADFASTGDFTFRFRTGTVTEADNDVEVYVYNATDETAGNPTLCGSDTTNGTAGTWATGTITAATLNAGCTGGTALNAGDIVEVTIKLMDNAGAPDFADVGYTSLAYNN